LLLLLRLLTSKVIYKIGVLAAILIVFIISSFAILAYFQSQQTLLGNSINIAGKNRFLTMNLLFQTSDYLNGVLSSPSSSNDIAKVNDAINKLDANIHLLKQGGKISGVELEPLPSKFLDSWKRIDNDWNSYRSFVMNRVVNPEKTLLQQSQQQAQLRTIINSEATTNSAVKTYESTKTELELLAANLINSSDGLVTQLGIDSAKNSLNVVFLEILFGVMNIAVVLLIIYFVTRILKPIGVLTRATSEIKKGNLNFPVQEQRGNDELSILSESFNSMVQSIKYHTSELKKLNEQLEQKDKLKDEFINIAAHELRAPIQPIVGLSEVIRSRRSRSSSSNTVKGGDDEEFLDIIVRNSKRLQALSENILDITKIESQTLKLNKEKFNINEKIRNVINDIKSKERDKIKITFDEPTMDPIVVQADKIRIYQVISNLLTNAIKFTKKSIGGGDVSSSSDSITVFTSINKSNNTYEKNTDISIGYEVIINIKDRGTGIDPDIQDKLFSKFVTKSDTGSGLGLYICKGIVEAHHGRIWAENNTDGKGATFSFSLPIKKN
jgi:signal transduction histidine kinase